MKKMILLVVILGFLVSSCNYGKIIKPNGEIYPYICATVNSATIGEGFNETSLTSRSKIGCDSFQMVSDSNAFIWAEGRKMELKANKIITFASQIK